jgi:hypothetical protein
MRSTPMIDSSTVRVTPARVAAAPSRSATVSKKVVAPSCSTVGEFVTSTTTSAPASARSSSASDPATRSTPAARDSSTTSCPALRAAMPSSRPTCPVAPAIAMRTTFPLLG